MIRHTRFQNRIAESVFTLPACVVLLLLVWWLPHFQLESERIAGLALTLLVSYVLTETNNVYQLIRIRTRMMACVWLFLVACMPFLHTAVVPLLCALSLAACHFVLFRCYQSPYAVNGIFHSFLFLSLGSLCWSPLLLLAPCYWFHLSVFLRSMSLRTFWAGIFGLLLPYWLWFGYAFWTESLLSMQKHFSEIGGLFESVALFPLSLLTIPLSRLVSCLVVIFFVVWSLVHYLRNSYNDKIRVRMMLYIYVTQTLLLLVSLILFPQHFLIFSTLFFSHACFLLAHYFSLTGSRFSNILFCLFLLLCLSFPLLPLWWP